jgi:hypothetical protein
MAQMAPELTTVFCQSGKITGSVWIRLSGVIGRMRNLVILAASALSLALAGCSVGTLNLGAPNYKGQPLSAVTTKLGWPPNQTQTIAGQKVYTWQEGNALAGCQVQVVMAGDVIDSYSGTGDANICAQYGAMAGGLKGYFD